MYPRQYIQFLYTFNTLADYYECHDLLEDLWLEEGREPFYQGLLQVAVSIYHVQNGNLSGGQKMMPRAIQKLQNYPSEWMGIQLDQVVRDSQCFLQELHDNNRSTSFQIVIIDPSLTALVKQIQLDQS